jgi:hypothetical protein
MTGKLFACNGFSKTTLLFGAVSSAPSGGSCIGCAKTGWINIKVEVKLVRNNNLSTGMKINNNSIYIVSSVV